MPKKKTTSRKKAPRRTKPPVKSKVSAEVTIDTSPVKARDQARDRLMRLRMEAQYLYVSSLDGITISDIAKDPRFAGAVAPKTLENWSQKDKWNEKRRDMLAKLHGNLDQQMRGVLTASLQARIADLQAIRDEAVSRLRAAYRDGRPVLEAKSWEGVAKVLMTANQELDDLRQQTAGNLLPGEVADPGMAQIAEKTEGHPGTKVEYDDDELRTAAKAILQKRRAALREARGREGQSQVDEAGEEGSS